MNKNVLNKLSKIESKVELAEVKVDLALIDDFESALKGLVVEPKNENTRKVMALVTELEKRINDAKVVLTRIPKVQQTGIQLEKAFKDLGVPLTSKYELMRDNLFKEEKYLKEQIAAWDGAITQMLRGNN